MAAARIFCKTTDKGIQSFFVQVDHKTTYFLFSQSYRKGVKAFYEKRPCLNDAMDFSRARKDSSVLHTMTKLPIYLRYLEQEYGLHLLRKTTKNVPRTYKAA